MIGFALSHSPIRAAVNRQQAEQATFIAICVKVAPFVKIWVYQVRCKALYNFKTIERIWHAKWSSVILWGSPEIQKSNWPNMHKSVSVHTYVDWDIDATFLKCTYSFL